MRRGTDRDGRNADDIRAASTPRIPVSASRGRETTDRYRGPGGHPRSGADRHLLGLSPQYWAHAPLLCGDATGLDVLPSGVDSPPPAERATKARALSPGVPRRRDPGSGVGRRRAALRPSAPGRELRLDRCGSGGGGGGGRPRAGRRRTRDRSWRPVAYRKSVV